MEKCLREAEEEMGFPLKVVKEGRVIILAPDPDYFKNSMGHFDPAHAPVFYNPRMEMNRDIAIIAANVFRRIFFKKGLKICEPFCSTGVRGIRYAVEVEDVDEVIMGDISEKAVKLAKINVKINEVKDKVKVLCIEANVLLSLHAKRGRRFSIIDLDPFGSPMPFMSNAIRAIERGGMICATATDLPPLFGAHPKACLRKYHSLPLRCEFSPEIGARILLGAMCREAAKYEAGIEVLFTYYADHYVRTYVRLSFGASRADESLSHLGFIAKCSSCAWRGMMRGFIPVIPTKCPSCGDDVLVAGPLWCGPLVDYEYCKKMLEEVMLTKVNTRKRIIKLLSLILEEARSPGLYYTTEEFASKMGVSEPSPRKVVEELRDRGFIATLTHYDPKGFRTNAEVKDIEEVILDLSRRLSGKR